jgi:hypothetical protein
MEIDTQRQAGKLKYSTRLSDNGYHVHKRLCMEGIGDSLYQQPGTVACGCFYLQP